MVASKIKKPLSFHQKQILRIVNYSNKTTNNKKQKCEQKPNLKKNKISIQHILKYMELKKN
jgi:hypothetical protein